MGLRLNEQFLELTCLKKCFLCRVHMTFVWVVVLTDPSVMVLPSGSIETSASYPLGCVCSMSFTCF